MEVEHSLAVTSGSTLRPNDHVHLFRGPLLEQLEYSRTSTEVVQPNGYAYANVHSRPGTPSQDQETKSYHARADGALLSSDRTTDLFRSKIEDARRDTDNVFEGNEAVGQAVKPKLTLDLGYSNMARLPESVVDLIKAEVERLSLSNNQIWHIPLRFSECVHLRYLNIRSNAFKEIPKGVYKLPMLEILDISRNKIRKISRDIRSLATLRVLSVVHNRIDDLPGELCEMTKLQILKIAENPLRFRLKKVIEVREAEVAFSEMTENERETVVTAEIKRHLREIYSVVTPADVDSGGEFGDTPTDTPRPLKRVLSSRFPVIPSTSSALSDKLSDPIARSPGKPPPIPTRSHYRMTSGQFAPALRRPGLTPLINNERNRSNSESVLQASQAARNKRMGMLRKEKPELDPVEEVKTNRLSHLRGFSHSSVLRAKNGSLPSPGGPNSSSPNSPRDGRRRPHGLIKRLSSLPEHKSEHDWNNPIIEGAKGILYALYQIHPHISGLIAAVKGKDIRRISLEFTFYNASTHVDKLNEAIETADSLREDYDDAVEKAEETVRRDCVTCMMAYAHVTTQLQESVRKIVSGTDARYVRTLMLLLYGSMIEIQNAISSFGIGVKIAKGSVSIGSADRSTAMFDEFLKPQQVTNAATPTRDRNIYISCPGGRLRSETTIQHSRSEDFVLEHSKPASLQENGAQKLPSRPPTPLTGTTLHSVIHHNPTQSSASTANSQVSGLVSAVGTRSRSTSQTANASVSATTSLLPSMVNTPRSGESFNMPPIANFASRVNPTTGLTETQEESVFEQIFLALSRAYDAALQSVPIVQRQFERYLEAAEEKRQPKEVRELWGTLIWRCKTCLDASETLKSRLINMKLKDPALTFNGVGSGRNDPSFWQQTRGFTRTFVELALDMKEVRDLRLLPPELIVVLRPVQKASKEASKLVETGPWRHLTSDAAAVGAMHPLGPYSKNGNAFASGISGIGGIHGVNGVNSANTSEYAHLQQSQLHHSPFPPTLVPVPPLSNGSITNGASPISAPSPATPISAAVGSAAQVTVPLTPNIPPSEQFFQGNVFQRADQLLSMPQAGTINFLNRR